MMLIKRIKNTRLELLIEKMQARKVIYPTNIFYKKGKFAIFLPVFACPGLILTEYDFHKLAL